jgi:hypothetical protein
VKHVLAEFAPTFCAGAVFGSLFVLAAERLLMPELERIEVVQQRPGEIIRAYKSGHSDALRTNPPSWELEQSCLEIWANRQPTQ